eukprot:1147543-Pelagomonas_calceolata.AAC.2
MEVERWCCYKQRMTQPTHRNTLTNKPKGCCTSAIVPTQAACLSEDFLIGLFEGLGRTGQQNDRSNRSTKFFFSEGTCKFWARPTTHRLNPPSSAPTGQ